jgi:DNA-binding transcriptional ArsR family regulator
MGDAKRLSCFTDVSPEDLGIRGPGDPRLGEARRLAGLLRVLSSPHRLAILRLVSASPLPVCMITAALRIDQTLVSHHLAILRRAGLVRTIVRGRYRLYEADRERIEGVLEGLAGYLGAEALSPTPQAMNDGG